MEDIDDTEPQNEGKKAIISCVCWVDRGYAKAVLDEADHNIMQMVKGKDPKELMKGELGEAAQKLKENEDMDDGQSSEDLGEEESVPIFTTELGMLKKDKNDLDEDDKMNADYPDELSDSSEEKDDYTIRKSDSLIIAATAEEDYNNLEIYIYDHNTSDLYVHHEVILGAMPLCLQWLNSWQGQKTNHIICGTFLPEIEIWNLDSENCEPTAILGSL